MVSLLDVIAMVESDNSALALRFEPRLYAQNPTWLHAAQDELRKRHPWSHDTCRQICATSYGAWQMLGANIVTVRPTFHPSFYTADMQKEDAEAFMKRLGFDPHADYMTIDKLRFASKWNGPGNVEDYVVDMERAHADLVASGGAMLDSSNA